MLLIRLRNWFGLHGGCGNHGTQAEAYLSDLIDDAPGRGGILQQDRQSFTVKVQRSLELIVLIERIAPGNRGTCGLPNSRLFPLIDFRQSLVALAGRGDLSERGEVLLPGGGRIALLEKLVCSFDPLVQGVDPAARSDQGIQVLLLLSGAAADKILQGSDDKPLYRSPPLDPGQRKGRLLIEVGPDRFEPLQGQGILSRSDIDVHRLVSTEDLVPHQLFLMLLFLQAVELRRHPGSVALQGPGLLFVLSLQLRLPLLQLTLQFAALHLGRLEVLLILPHQAGNRLLALSRNFFGLAAECLELGFQIGAFLHLEGV